jgi:hypothetical protein
MSQAIALPIKSDADWSAKDHVSVWRCRELLRAGYGRQDALLLAVSHEVDLHLAIDLPSRGCPHETALRILL